MNGDWDFLLHLHNIGRRRADDWLAVNFDRLGVESSISLESKYL
jgi:NTE family protein